MSSRPTDVEAAAHAIHKASEVATWPWRNLTPGQRDRFTRFARAALSVLPAGPTDKEKRDG